MLRLPATLAILAVTLASCGPTSYVSYSKPGATTDVATRTFAACRQEANTLFPAAIFTQTVPGYGGYGGIYAPPGAYGGFGGSYVQSSDANAPLRAQHLRDCMTLKGYSQVIHPICTTEQLGGRQYQAVAKPPSSASPNICAARTAGGSTTLIDLSKPI